MMTLIQKKICLMGNFSVGKTSLVRRYVEGVFEERYLSTIGVKISRKTMKRADHDLNLILWDLAGGEEFVRYQASYLRGAAGALVVCDLTRRETLESLHTYAGQLLAVNPEAQMVLIGNKSDLEGQFEFEGEELEKVSAALQCSWLLTSAKSGDQVEDAFLTLADLIEPAS